MDRYISELGFAFLQPEFPWPKPIDGFTRTFPRLRRFLEASNTLLMDASPQTKRALYDLCRVPRMSTFAIAAIINESVRQMNDGTVYLNVGVWNGFTFLAGMVGNPDKVCVGVDNFSEFGGPREALLERLRAYPSAGYRFYDMDYRKYFANVHKEPIGLYLYDGSHAYEDQLQALQIAEPFFAPGCVILVDDTNWSDPRRATLDFVRTGRHTYRTILDRRTAYSGHPTLWNGLMVLRRTELRPRNSES